MSGHVDIPQSTHSAASGTFKGVVSLAFITMLCLPSLIGGAALLLQVVQHRDIKEWNDTASALIALGSLFGAPLVGTAAIIGAVISLSRAPATLKYADLCIVSAAALASLSLLLKFAK